MPQYIQAWERTKPGHPGGYVYTQQAAIDAIAEGFDVQAVTIVRYADGGRDYLPGVLADHVGVFHE